MNKTPIEKIALLLLLVSFTSCKGQQTEAAVEAHAASPKTVVSTTKEDVQEPSFDADTKSIHITVALCDNKYQGIVPVPAKLGNGQDPANNLYWGALYGIKTFFKRSDEWRLLKQTKVDSLILERLVFKHQYKNYYLIADAYNGKHIKQATIDFLASSAGMLKDTLHINDKVIGTQGHAELLAYIGHDGLMDFSLDMDFENADDRQRALIVLACYSKSYFEPYVKAANAKALVWTTGLMAPEAYTVHDAIAAYVAGASDEDIRLSAAKAYHHYQKCGLNAAKRLLVAN